MSAPGQQQEVYLKKFVYSVSTVAGVFLSLDTYTALYANLLWKDMTNWNLLT